MVSPKVRLLEFSIRKRIIIQEEEKKENFTGKIICFFLFYICLGKLVRLARIA